MSEPAAELMAALAKAQGAFLPIEKNREVEITTKAGYKYKFRYADLEEIIGKTRPALSANGLSMIQTVEHGQNGPLLSCRLMHAGGGMIASEVLIPSARDYAADPKAFGAAITYYRRYMVTAMLGVAADDDLDSDGQDSPTNVKPTSQKPSVVHPQRREAPAKAEPSATPAAVDMAYATPGELAFVSKKLSAKGWTIPQAYDAAGITYDDGASMTKADFSAIKGVL